jgi:FtsZ-binding cell division protein ZapB
VNKQKITIYLLLLAILGCVVLGVILNFKNTALQKAKLKNGAYEQQFKEAQDRIESLQFQSEVLEEEIAARDKRIRDLLFKYNEIPKDHEIIYQDATLVDANSDWGVLLRAAEIVDDSTFFQP